MEITLIAAMGHDRVIGRDNRLPWHLPADLAHFKALTLGKPVIMGRLTWLSLGRPLPGRHNIVLSRDASFEAAGATVVTLPQAALLVAGAVDEVMVIGGAQIYQLFLPLATRMELTEVDCAVEGGDAFFPHWPLQQWQQVAAEAHNADARNPHPYRFVSYRRR